MMPNADLSTSLVPRKHELLSVAALLLEVTLLFTEGNVMLVRHLRSLQGAVPVEAGLPSIARLLHLHAVFVSVQQSERGQCIHQK
jgi:hypothetical protein